MIIDADTHIAPFNVDHLTRRGVGSFLMDEHIDALDQAGIDKALVWLSPHHYNGTAIEEHNAYVYAAARKYPTRLLPFGWTDPTNGIDHAKKMVRICAEEYGFLGIKMNGAQNNYFIDDPEIGFPIAEEIARTGKMLAFHIGPDAYEKTHPSRAVRIAKAFPETPILLIHMGMTNRDMNRAVFEAAEECPNIYLIASATSEVVALVAIRRLGADRVCFGSDYPFRRMDVIRAMFETAYKDVLSEDDFANFMGRNLARLCSLPLEDQPYAPHPKTRPLSLA